MQAGSIHSGSISFGRFETEPLSWERRSSFSRNRYLEEVEKCSTPGSGIKKKEYFEAHFKKKGLFGIIPSTGHDRLDRETSEIDTSETIATQQDFESNDNLCVQSDQSPQEDFESNKDGNCVQIEKRFEDAFEPNEYDYYVQFDQGSHEDFGSNEDGHCVQYDQRYQDDVELDGGGQRSQEGFKQNEYDHYVPCGEIHFDSDYHGECDVNGYEREDSITDEAQQSENETINILSATDNIVIDVKKDDGNTVNTYESSIDMPITVNEPARGIEETILHDPKNPSPQVCMNLHFVPLER